MIAEADGVPEVVPVAGGTDRPFWSVMIPAYDADAYLEETLGSVLAQDPGADRMQIGVVDDASPGADRAREIVRRLAPGRVEFHGSEENLGLAGNWNRCIRLSRGRWVHLLHQDDLVLPGFYGRIEAAAAGRPGLSAAFCRHRTIDGRGETLRVSEPERETPGTVDDLLARLATGQRIQCPSIAVSRSTYERVGGFREDLCYSLDWEMWARVAADGPVWYEPEPMACYRVHPGNESSRLVRAGADLDDAERCLGMILGRLPEEDRPALRRRAGAFLGILAMSGAVALMNEGDWRSGLARRRRAARLDPSLADPRAAWGFRRWALKIWWGGLRGASRPPVPSRGPA
jgi:hypothetical protein